MARFGRAWIIGFVAAASIGAAFAQDTTPSPSAPIPSQTTTLPAIGNASPSLPATLPAIAPAVAPAAPISSPGSQTTISTTAPINASTTIDVGTYAGQALMWVASVFGTTIGAALTTLFYQMLKNAGIQGNELLRGKLQDIIVNGINAGAKAANERLAGRGQVEIKNEVVAKAVEYAQTHGADTLKKLGLDPTSPQAVEAIKARIETAINDPATPTPAVLSPPKPAAPPKVV